MQLLHTVTACLATSHLMCQHVPVTAMRAHVSSIRMESEMQWRKRTAEQKDAAAAAGGASDGAKPKQPNLSTSVDNMDFFGGGAGLPTSGGGQLTREGIANAQRTRSKSIDAMDALQEAVKMTGDLPPDEAAEELQRVIGDAYEAGVSVTAPTMKRAAALLAALEEAKANSARTAQANAEDKELGTKLDALFGGGFAEPSFELDPDLQD